MSRYSDVNIWARKYEEGKQLGTSKITQLSRNRSCHERNLLNTRLKLKKTQNSQNNPELNKLSWVNMWKT